MRYSRLFKLPVITMHARPILVMDCIMFSHNPGRYCRVCAEAIERIIDLYAE